MKTCIFALLAAGFAIPSGFAVGSFLKPVVTPTNHQAVVPVQPKDVKYWDIYRKDEQK